MLGKGSPFDGRSFRVSEPIIDSLQNSVVKERRQGQVLGIDKMVISGIVNLTVIINSVFPEGVADRGRPFKILLLFSEKFPSES